MTREPADVTFGAIGGGVILAAGAAVVLIIYAMIALVEVVPASLAAQEFLRLAF